MYTISILIGRSIITINKKTWMPMKNDITSELNNDENKSRKVVAPSVRTLDFIKQFARSYYVEQKLPNPLSGICVN